MLTEEEIDKLFTQVEDMLDTTDEEMQGIVVFVNLETHAHVYGVGSGKDRLVESMKLMVRELDKKPNEGRVN